MLVKPSGTLTFRLDYRMNGRRETVTFGKYGPAGLSLARARELFGTSKGTRSRLRLARERRCAL
ncbi:MAG TPA: Arm DNA-binding domain-containing protein [Ferrovibrio sp.]